MEGNRWFGILQAVPRDVEETRQIVLVVLLSKSRGVVVQEGELVEGH
jgi:hypothetical protein